MQLRPIVYHIQQSGKSSREVLSPNGKPRWPDRYAFYADGRTGEWVQRGRRYKIYLGRDNITPAGAGEWQDPAIQVLQAELTGIERHGVLSLKYVVRYVERITENGRTKVVRVVAKTTGKGTPAGVPIDGDLRWKYGGPVGVAIRPGARVGDKSVPEPAPD